MTKAANNKIVPSHDRNEWSYEDYQNTDPKALQEMAAKDEPKFKALFEAHFGKELVIEDEKEGWDYADYLKNNDFKGLFDLATTDETKFWSLFKAHYDNNQNKPKKTVTVTAGRTGWTYADYQEKAPKELQAMATNDEHRFRALYKAHYGTEPQ